MPFTIVVVTPLIVIMKHQVEPLNKNRSGGGNDRRKCG